MGHKQKVKIVKVRMEQSFYDKMEQYIREQGFSTVSEFIRLSIREALSKQIGKQIDKAGIEVERE